MDLGLPVGAAYLVRRVIADFAQQMLIHALVVQLDTHSELMVLVRFVKIAVGLVAH